MPAPSSTLEWSRPYRGLNGQNQCRVETADGRVVFTGYAGSDDDLQRIIACWNACADIETSHLEEYSDFGGLVRVIQERRSLERQLAAAEAAVAEVRSRYARRYQENLYANRSDMGNVDWGRLEGAVRALEAVRAAFSGREEDR